MRALALRRARPDWCTGPVLVLLLGAFVSSVGVLLVAPFLSIYLHRTGGVPAAAVGLLLGVSYWSTRASGLVAGALAGRMPPRRVMLSGNGMRAAGYLLLATGSPAWITAAVLLVGTGSGLFFPVSKAYLLRLVDDEHQLPAISARNVCANTGVALGPLLGMAVFAAGPRLLFPAAAAVFGLLTLVLLRLPEVGGEPPAASYWRSAAALAVRRSVVVVMVGTALLGLAVVQLESALPLLVARGPTTALAGLVFLVNAGIVVAAQPAAVRVVTRLPGRASTAGGFGLFAAGILLVSVPPAVWPLWLAGVVLFSAGEVWVSLWIDDRVRREEPAAVAAVYGLSGVSDACGGFAGAWLGTALAGSHGAAVPGLPSSYWTLAVAVTAAAALACALLPGPGHPPPAAQRAGREIASEVGQ